MKEFGQKLKLEYLSQTEMFPDGNFNYCNSDRRKTENRLYAIKTDLIVDINVVKKMNAQVNVFHGE